jgi:hypothetical protein
VEPTTASSSTQVEVIKTFPLEKTCMAAESIQKSIDIKHMLEKELYKQNLKVLLAKCIVLIQRQEENRIQIQELFKKLNDKLLLLECSSILSLSPDGKNRKRFRRAKPLQVPTQEEIEEQNRQLFSQFTDIGHQFLKVASSLEDKYASR